MQVIALTGYPRAGKDTVVQIFKKLYPNSRIVQIAFADELKQLHMASLGMRDLITYNYYLHEELRYNKIDLRKTLADFSDMLLRTNPSYHVDSVRRKIKILTHTDLVIISDLRYPIEYGYATINDYPVIRLKRHNVTLDDKLLRWNAHIENFIPQYTLDNTRDLDHLAQQLERLISTLDLQLVK